MKELHREGYTRIVVEQDPEAVAWWYVHDFGDGFVFARGGRTATSRKARSHLHVARVLSRVEHAEWECRPRFALARDGDLVPLALP